MMATEKSQTYDFFDPVYDGTFEVPIDTEYNLPDYCPDIQRILTCQAVPEISGYLISEDTLTCEGVCEVRVLYLDTKGSDLRCCDFRKEFTASVSLKAGTEKAVAWVQAEAGHFTCRAVSARRVELHMAVAVKALAVVQRQVMIPSAFPGEGIERRTDTCPVSQAVNALTHQFTAEDTLTLKNGKPPIETILRKNVECRVSETRVEEHCLTVSGSLNVSFLYLSALDHTTVEKFQSSIDFTQVIDCNGGGEDCLMDFRAQVGECTIQPQEDDMGECTGVHVVCKVFVAAYLYRASVIEAVNDAYCIHAPLSLHSSQTGIVQVDGTRTESIRKKCVLSAQEDEIETVLDLWCTQNQVQTTCEKGRMSVRVQCRAAMLYRGVGGKLCYIEMPVDYQTVTELENTESRRTETTARTELWEFRIVDKSHVELTLETTAAVFLYRRSTLRYLSSAVISEDTPAYEADPRLVLYYASGGESVWKIAKSHRVLLSDLRDQNDIYEDTVPESRPLILCCRV